MNVNITKEELSQLEQQISNLSKEIEELANDETLPDKYQTKEIQCLLETKTKLEYQIVHLQQSIDVEMKRVKPSTCMRSIMDELIKAFDVAIKKAYPKIIDVNVLVSVSQFEKNGDYQCNNAMSLAGLLKKKTGTKVSPRNVADEIIKHLPSCDLISKVEVAGPGFINIYLCNTTVKKSLSNLLVNGVKAESYGKKGRVVIDYSSPNIAKEMHVGHLRSTIIGDCLANLFEYLGHDVLRLNHVGDWGTQFGMLIAHLMDEFPDYKEKSPPIHDLQAFYKASKKRFDNEVEFKDRAHKYVVKLQNKNPDFIKAWNLICDVSRKDFQKIYDRLNITNLIERGESFYHDLMPKIVEECDKLGLIVEENGQKLIFPEGCQYPLIVQKSDGGYTYDSSDLACIKQRLFEEKGDILLYVTDCGQSSHFDLIFKTARKANWYDPQKTRVKHIPFGCVLGEDKKKFKTRSGDTVRLTDLLDEGVKRCEDKLKEKGRDKELTSDELEQVKTAVAYGCIKYADLSHNLTHDYIFSFDKMLDDRGNTAAYLLYAYTRIKSITRNSKIKSLELEKAAKQSLENGLNINHEKEFKLAKCILKFPDVLNRVAVELTPHFLCEYLYLLSSTFTEFYDNCYCIEKSKENEVVKVHIERLLLCEATANIMAQSFKILGLKTVEKM